MGFVREIKTTLFSLDKPYQRTADYFDIGVRTLPMSTMNCVLFSTYYFTRHDRHISQFYTKRKFVSVTEGYVLNRDQNKWP